MVRVLDAALGSAWAMEEPALRQLLEVAAREHQITPEALQAYKAGALEKGERATFRDGVAILDVSGPLFKRANLMTEYCGASSYDVLMRDFRTALDDGNVRAILFNIDSPGGEASGCGEFASAVAAARGGKPIVAYAGDLAASAAYWIGSACDRLVIGAGAAVGSIGVRCSITDSSDRDAKSGLRRFDFVSSQSPFKVSDPKTDDGNARIQARVDALASVFVGAVAENRKVPVPQVLEGFGKGDVLIGAAAVAAGMADSVGTFESLLASLSTETDPLASIGSFSAAVSGIVQEEQATMPTEAEVTAAVDAARAETTATLTAAHTAALATASAAAKAEGADAARTEERARVAAIHAAHVAGYESERDEAIQSGSSAAEFKTIIVDKEHAKAQARASAVAGDVEANKVVQPSTARTEAKTGDDAAVAAILGAMKFV